ncbi:hypothetical protein T484DRAFT_3298053 [Baffinella frigidus]|nr:hypothetical protein T484DRAFT_3298053 [Cryptophyta sp. CCMP2293]
MAGNAAKRLPRPANVALLLLFQLLQNCAAPVQGFAPPSMQILPGFGPPSPGVILSRVAEVGLKLKLARHRGVAVDVTASPAKILAGGVEGVQVSGKLWASPGKLTCKQLDVQVGETVIDIPQLLSPFSPQIVMKVPARGTAAIVFDPADWGNFLVHELVGKAQLPQGEFRFSRAGASIDAARQCALFSGEWRGEQVQLELSQSRQGGEVSVREAGKVDGEGELCGALAAWFQDLDVNLDGAHFFLEEIRFGAPNLVRLKLNVRVDRFPNPITTSF